MEQDPRSFRRDTTENVSVAPGTDEIAPGAASVQSADCPADRTETDDDVVLNFVVTCHPEQR
ncbi:hypothetical protein [Nocardia sp. NPDC019395]|uniref:hypothetical protein n=1 Tax=Nocardia sp. NPDC019395 TaxID=3154686 RepID=UPI0033D1DEC2